MRMGDCFRAPEKPFTAGLRDWLGIPEPIMACSGTAAFVVALRTLARRNPGRSRVVVPAYTCPLVPLAVRLAGLRAVACDTLPGGLESIPARSGAAVMKPRSPWSPRIWAAGLRTFPPSPPWPTTAGPP